MKRQKRSNPSRRKFLGDRCDPRAKTILITVIKTAIIIIFLNLSGASAQPDSIRSGVYEWKDYTRQNSKTNSAITLFEGSAHNLKWLQLTSNILPSSKTKRKVHASKNEEQLLIVKSGSLIIGKDSMYVIGPGSVALLMPGETYTLERADSGSCSYYLMKYRSNSPDLQRGLVAGGSLIKDWNKIDFKPHDKGGRRDFFERPTAMCKRFEMHVTTLKAGVKSHDPHTHTPNEIIIVINGKTEMQIGNRFFKGNAGSVYFLSSNILHGIRNDGDENCSYFAFQFE